MDIAFVGSRWVFGIPEHSESYALRDTVQFEPYRLYNLDVFEYEYHSPMALYGSIPYLVRKYGSFLKGELAKERD